MTSLNHTDLGIFLKICFLCFRQVIRGKKSEESERKFPSLLTSFQIPFSKAIRNCNESYEACVQSSVFIALINKCKV